MFKIKSDGNFISLGKPRELTLEEMQKGDKQMCGPPREQCEGFEEGYEDDEIDEQLLEHQTAWLSDDRFFE